MVTLLWKNLSKGLEQAFSEPYLIIWLVLITMQRNVLLKISIKDLREFIQPLLCANYWVNSHEMWGVGFLIPDLQIRKQIHRVEVTCPSYSWSRKRVDIQKVSVWFQICIPSTRKYGQTNIWNCFPHRFLVLKIHNYIQNRNRRTDTENKLWLPNGERRRTGKSGAWC